MYRLPEHKRDLPFPRPVFFFIRWKYHGKHYFPRNGFKIFFFVTENRYVYCELGSEIIYTILINFRLQKVKEILFLVVDGLQSTKMDEFYLKKANRFYKRPVTSIRHTAILLHIYVVCLRARCSVADSRV
jgi:hypothetical protein